MRDDDVRLSIIITCFNYEDFVARAIDSVLSQRDGRCELLVVDDGSSDRSWSVIEAYGLPGAFRLRNGGAARAGLHALGHARGGFVLFLDADDELAPGSLAEIVPRLDAGVAKLQFPLLPIDERGRCLGAASPRLGDRREREALQRRVLRTGVYDSPPTSGNVFRRDLCELLGQVDYEMSVDGVTLFAAPFFGDVVSVAKPLGFYRLHGRNYSQAGSRPTAARFAAEADRFAARHGHLRRILAGRGVTAGLADARDTFFFRERRLYQSLLEGVRPTLRDTLRLQRLAFASMAGTMAGAVDRLTLGLFLGSFILLPRRLWPQLLAWRFRPRGRGRKPPRRALGPAHRTAA